MDMAGYDAIEDKPGMLSNEDECIHSTHSHRKYDGIELNPKISLLLLAFVVLFAVAYHSHSWPLRMDTNEFYSDNSQTDINSVILIAHNEYGVYSGPYSWLNVSTMVIVEPFKQTDLWLSGLGNHSSSYVFEWGINSDSGGEHRNYTGGNVTHMFQSTGYHTIRVSVFNIKDSQTTSFLFTAVCK